MRKVNTSAEALEQVVGSRRPTMLMKAVDALDDATTRVLAYAPIAAFGSRDDSGEPSTTFVGGTAGFTEVLSRTRIRLPLPPGATAPKAGSGASMLYLFPGVGETLRVNGVVDGRTDGSVELELREVYVHCARCILRSRLWETVTPAPEVRHESPSGTGPLADHDVAAFVSASPFLVVTSWDGSGGSDTSPRGDDPGFLLVLDARTLAIPDRKGNTRTDTFHNLIECDDVSVAAIKQGSDEVLHLRGHAYVTDDESLVATMALSEGSRPPAAALIIEIEHAAIASSQALRDTDLWDPTKRVDAVQMPDLMQLSTQHLAATKAKGATAAAARILSKGLARAPRILRRGVDHGYRKELADEGYEGRG